jgi:hypothetical protein
MIVKYKDYTLICERNEAKELCYSVFDPTNKEVDCSYRTCQMSIRQFILKELIPIVDDIIDNKEI